MRLQVNQFLDYVTTRGTPGRCKLWVCKGDDGSAVVVLTELPADPSPGSLYSSIELACGEVRAAHKLTASRTIWFHRQVKTRKREQWTEFTFAMTHNGQLTSPVATPSTRCAAEVLAERPLPPIAPDEHTDH